MRAMNKWSIGLALLFVLLAPRFCLSQTPEWNLVQQLSSDQQIKVVLSDGKSHHGRFQSATDTALVVHSSSGDQTLSRSDIGRVLIEDPWSPGPKRDNRRRYRGRRGSGSRGRNR